MRLNNRVVLGFLALALCAVPRVGLAQQQQVDAGQLARVRSLLQSSRAELSQEQFLLLSGKLAQTEQAYTELTALTEAGAGAAETAGAVATGRAILGGAAELLPLLIAIWPATAHAPGIKEEKPQVRAARAKLDEKLKELAQAAQQVDGERKVERERKRKKCFCLCIADNLLQGSESLENEAECRKFCPTRWPGTRGKCK